MNRERLVVIGNGLAGMRTVDELLKRAPDRYAITVFGAEPHGNYNRILLSPVLAGEKCFDDIVLHPLPWYAANGITLRAGDPVVSIDRAQRSVRSVSGQRVPYDRLLIATGSLPAVLPVPGRALPGVVAFRDIADVEAMLAAARQHRRAIVIGAGVLGLEAACGLRAQGMEVTVVHRGSIVMERQLDAVAASLLQADLERRGIVFELRAQTVAIEGEERVTGLRLADGRVLPAGLIVMAAGIRPNDTLAREAGLLCGRAITVDDALLSSDPAIHAVGECIEHRGSCYGLVAPLWEQAEVCAAQLAGDTAAAYAGSRLSTRLKVTGIDVFSAGDFADGDDREVLIYRDPARGLYRRLVLKQGRLCGAVLVGDIRDSNWYLDLLNRGVDIGPLRATLIFGRAFCEADATVLQEAA